MLNSKDQIGRLIKLEKVPKRIISLVPSQTELLFDLGLEQEIVGVTGFCVHPKSARKNTTVIGGTKDPKIDRILALNPDLVIANKEENRKEDVEILAQHCPTWVSDVSDLASALAMIREVGALVGREGQAAHMASQIADGFAGIERPASRTDALYLIWRKPWMAAGRGTFIDAMMRQIGLQNALEQDRYPELSEAAMAELQPKHLLLSSEPYPFTQKHLRELQTICPKSQIHLVDGEMFSWYGSRLLPAAAYLKALPGRLSG